MDVLLKEKKKAGRTSKEPHSHYCTNLLAALQREAVEGVEKKGKQEISDKTARENKLSIEDKRKCKRTRKKRNEERRKRT